HHVHRRRPGRELRQGPPALALPGARPLRHVSRNRHRVGPQVGDHGFERFDLLEVGEPTEVDGGEVQQWNGHGAASTLYVRVASPLAGTLTRNRTSVADSFSAGTLLSVTRHTPKRASRTSTDTAWGLAFAIVTR